MYQQQNYTNYYPQRTISLKGRPVTSLDEAKYKIIKEIEKEM